MTSLQQAFLKKLETIEKAGAASQAEVLNLRLQLIANEALLRRSRSARDLLEGPFGGAARAEARFLVEEITTQIAGLETRLAQVGRDLSALTIRSPIAGSLVAATRRDAGETIAAGEELFEIAPGSVNRILLDAPFDRLHRIKPGMSVRFRAASESDALAPPGRAVLIRIERATTMPGISATEPSPEAPSSSLAATATVLRAEVISTPSELVADVPVTAEIILGSEPLWRLMLIGRKLPQSSR